MLEVTATSWRGPEQMESAALNGQQRTEALRAMTEDTLDVLVVGGGIVGVGCALDAATRGLSVGLVEARDLASGTSSRSSKLIHGGLRYLEMLELGLVGEALRERGRLLNEIAPHLVRPVPFLYPLRHRVWERLYAGAGVALYDLLAHVGRRSRRMPTHRHLSRSEALRLAPGLRPDSLVGALQYCDAHVDDARFALFVARTAASYGARVATRSPVTELVREDGRVVGARVVDELTGAGHTIRAHRVILAAGVWTNELLASTSQPQALTVRASKGVHLVVPGDRIRSETGLILRTDVSVLFVIPWGPNWIVGTTDTDWTGDKAHPAANAEDIDYLLRTVNRVLAEPLTREDVIGVYAGLRPLVADSEEQTTKVSREHAVTRPEPGLTVVAGGKYTTYRVMAEDAVDEALADRPDPPPSVTARTPLVGADGYADLASRAGRLAEQWRLDATEMESLLGRYGSLVDEVLAPAADEPALMEPVAGAPTYLLAEVLYAVTHEGALHLEDVLTRRTRISVDTRDRGLSASHVVAAVMARELGWDTERTDREVAHYRARVDAELASQEAPDDESANRARLAAPEVTAVVGR